MEKPKIVIEATKEIIIALIAKEELRFEDIPRSFESISEVVNKTYEKYEE